MCPRVIVPPLVNRQVHATSRAPLPEHLSLADSPIGSPSRLPGESAGVLPVAPEAVARVNDIDSQRDARGGEQGILRGFGLGVHYMGGTGIVYLLVRIEEHG